MNKLENKGMNRRKKIGKNRNGIRMIFLVIFTPSYINKFALNSKLTSALNTPTITPILT